MNKTLIALVAVTLGALLPAPTAQGMDTVTACAQKEIEDRGLIVPTLADACVIDCNDQPGVLVASKEVCLTDGPLVLEIETCEDGSIGVRAERTKLCRDVPGEIDPCMFLGCDDMPDLLDAGSDGPHHPCKPSYSEDDGGFGGSHATCYYSCKETDTIAIHIVAEDPDAKVSGYTDCGDAHADCPKRDVTCAGAAPGLAGFDDQDQGCVGDTHEFYSSKITVTCVAGGLGLVCQLTGALCQPSTASSAASTCILRFPDLEPNIRALMANFPSTEFMSFVTYEFVRDEAGTHGFVVRFENAAGKESCAADSF